MSAAVYLYGFALALIAPILALATALIFGVKVGLRSRGFTLATAAVPVTLAVNPAIQATFLEDLDVRQSQALQQRVETARLVGKREPAVTAALGRPNRVRVDSPQVFTLDGRLIWEGRPDVVWEYQPVPYYWGASTLQVHFQDGVVTRYASTSR